MHGRCWHVSWPPQSVQCWWTKLPQHARWAATEASPLLRRAVIPDVITRDECSAYIDSVWNWLESLGTGAAPYSYFLVHPFAAKVCMHVDAHEDQAFKGSKLACEVHKRRCKCISQEQGLLYCEGPTLKLEMRLLRHQAQRRGHLGRRPLATKVFRLRHHQQAGGAALEASPSSTNRTTRLMALTATVGNARIPYQMRSSVN